MRGVIVIGGSAGGITALCSVLEHLPGNFPAAALAVIHTTEWTSALPEVLARCGGLKVVSPELAEPIAAGCLYVPAPNRHLIVKSNCAISWMGPRENRHRPAVDTLFRSAARVYRGRVIAVVLSGALDDGSAGALAVKSRGGTVIVQDPDDAEVGDMPANVLRQTKADYCLPASEIPLLLRKLVAKNAPMKVPKSKAQNCKNVAVATQMKEKEPFALTCPDCGGAVIQMKNGKSVQFRCHVGHNFSLESFSDAQADALERAVWVAIRKLNEQEVLQKTLAKTHSDNHRLQRRFLENAAAAEGDIRSLHEILARL
jgi:two-component system chemotaxis response regulator CheB